ncbi:carbohydrate ABC transporter permease [Thiospirochaeta perfilievii]|uniref:sn-glycerol-3-phosphate transport system permease protein UgpE n=1 Tax=Thiospirochaeta perfilievii TaxID=252967 RepID=A0A5C1QBL0_9SPIO|nr:carbohydrate ABC transporter permease [Thiospirochaeta perfilievii]QEN04054.1 carbohydrate ABC transporter permease [Thiospirochaeta perfilievii]
MKSINIRKRDISKFAITILLSLYAIVQLYPFIWLLFSSLKTNSELFGGNVVGFPETFLWENYKDAFFGGKVGLYLFNSTLVTTLTIVITILVSCMAAYAIARLRWKFSKVAMTFFLLGMMIPIHATLLPLFIAFKNAKILNSYLCLILPYVGFGIPIAMYILVGFMQKIPKEMEESAFIDGAGVVTSFYRIIMPMVKPAMATVAIFTFLSAWNELMFAITFISKSSFRTLTVGLQSMVGQYGSKWGPINAGLVIGTVPTIIIYSFMSSEIQHSLAAAGAVKG